jgi:hypothetical protein
MKPAITVNLKQSFDSKNLLFKLLKIGIIILQPEIFSKLFHQKQPAINEK